MILVYLMGGIGNQMFQYAAGKALAKRIGTELKVYFNEDEYPYVKYFYHLGVFKLKVDFPTNEEYKRFKPLKGIAKKIANLLGINANGRIVAQTGFEYFPSFFETPNDSYIKGFYQSHKFFSSIEQTIQKDFEFAQPATGLNAEFLAEINNTNSVSVHFRRGDYIYAKRTNEFHGVCSLEYYHEAVERVCSKLDAPTLFIFSNDMPFVKENFKTHYAIRYVEQNDFVNSHEDLRLMAACKHNIIANSSFSWWAAWLNRNPEKMVIAPGRWFAEESINTKDLIPSGWIKI
ncbi:MAG TPA: alpha-1,2-fucosyltransferase [Cytophagales bacterium]|nr:alpha-1,2-fucosyltransferase [Cytophagales bacterium]